MELSIASFRDIRMKMLSRAAKGIGPVWLRRLDVQTSRALW